MAFTVSAPARAGEQDSTDTHGPSGPGLGWQGQGPEARETLLRLMGHQVAPCFFGVNLRLTFQLFCAILPVCRLIQAYGRDYRADLRVGDGRSG